ncbi:unnamed protein product [Timema podura]|uniref:Ribosomal protein S10 n=1 Tax=Timema podura TaxID=61482 RepID=A0ABN7P008_TIMPD|nr:unnamed protein product [Timema podura]
MLRMRTVYVLARRPDWISVNRLYQRQKYSLNIEHTDIGVSDVLSVLRTKVYPSVEISRPTEVKRN